jgi:hypothetical protein
MTFQLLSEAAFSGNDVSFDRLDRASTGFIKVLATGHLNSQGVDRRLLLRVNRMTSGYRGFVLMQGDAGGGEWDETGFYLGRSGYNADAAFSLDLTIALPTSVQKITANGSSTFAHGANNLLLGYECHSVLVTNRPITQIDLLFTGGVVTGMCRVYSM